MESETGAQPVTEITDDDLAMLLGSTGRQRLVPPVDQRCDEQLVRLSGLQRVTSDFGQFGFQAASELMRRSPTSLSGTRCGL
jgi:hypothetical protein